jgi:acyl carrier protein
MTIHDCLKSVFAKTLEIASDADIDKISYSNYAGWDSVGHMRLVAALEMEFNVLLETEQILDLSTFAKALEILKAHGITD